MPDVSSNKDGLKLSQHSERGLPTVASVVTRAINIVVDGTTIGFLQSFQPTEGRNMHKIFECGNEDMVELMPGAMSENTISVSRVLLYNTRLIEVFDQTKGKHHNDHDVYPVSIVDFNFPFDIEVYISRPSKSSGESGNEDKKPYLLEVYKGCWFTNLKYELKITEDFQIIEEGTIQYTYKKGGSLRGNFSGKG